MLSTTVLGEKAIVSLTGSRDGWHSFCYAPASCAQGLCNCASLYRDCPAPAQHASHPAFVFKPPNGLLFSANRNLLRTESHQLQLPPKPQMASLAVRHGRTCVPSLLVHQSAAYSSPPPMDLLVLLEAFALVQTNVIVCRYRSSSTVC